MKLKHIFSISDSNNETLFRMQLYSKCWCAQFKWNAFLVLLFFCVRKKKYWKKTRSNSIKML
jgi:hypothetical protein